MRRGLALILFAGGTACATERGHTTWAEDAREGVVSQARAAAPAQPARKLAPVSIEPAPDSEAQTFAQEFELELLRFNTRHPEVPAAARRRGPWPRPIQAAWRTALDHLAASFEKPAGEVPRRVLVRARVTLEVEMEASRARYGAPPQDVAEELARVSASINALMRTTKPEPDDPALAGPAPALTWPVSPVVVTSGFGFRRDPIVRRRAHSFHSGVDLGRTRGGTVLAAGTGRVLSAGWLGGCGQTVIVQHPGGYQTLYGHLQRILVSVGTEVDSGTPLGIVGSTGRSTGPHLHFEVHRAGIPIDPRRAVQRELHIVSTPDDPAPRRQRPPAPDPVAPPPLPPPA